MNRRRTSPLEVSPDDGRYHSMSNATGAPTRAPRRKYRRYGRLIGIAAEISGCKPKSIYRVLAGEFVSAPIEEALYQAFLRIKATRKVAA